jgi:hypothetical protein
MQKLTAMSEHSVSRTLQLTSLVASLLFCICTAFGSVTYALHLQGEELEMGNLLEWRTSSEINCIHFVIEKSIDGIRFCEIGTVEAAGAADREASYHFLDIEASTSNSIYRLRQIDLDGSFSFSQTVTIRKTMPNQFSVLAISSTEVSRNLTLTINSLTTGDLRYCLTSYQGNAVLKGGQRLAGGPNEFMISMESFPAGIYKILLECGEEKESLVVRKIEPPASVLLQNYASAKNTDVN